MGVACSHANWRQVHAQAQAAEAGRKTAVVDGGAAAGAVGAVGADAARAIAENTGQAAGYEGRATTARAEACRRNAARSSYSHRHLDLASA